MFIHRWLTLGQPRGLADEPPPGSFSLSGHIRFPFRCFVSVLATSPPSRWASPWVFSSFHPSVISRADPLGAVEPERALITNPQASTQ